VAELDLVRPNGLVVLGGTAGKALYGSSLRVGETRGSRFVADLVVAAALLGPP
jgi:uracil-DNA glycosylase